MEVSTTAKLGDDAPVNVAIGVHTWFSIFVKRTDQEGIHNNDQMVTPFDECDDGKFDHLDAYVDTRIARDQFY